MGGIDMKRSEYEMGQYLFDGKHAFIHDGYVNADGHEFYCRINSDYIKFLKKLCNDGF